jgi:hypothetical protein
MRQAASQTFAVLTRARSSHSPLKRENNSPLMRATQGMGDSLSGDRDTEQGILGEESVQALE